MYLGHYIDKLIIINTVKITDICITPDMTSCHTIVITYLIMLLRHLVSNISRQII